jgi:hypothetical protein
MIKFFRKIRQNLLNDGLPAGQAGKTTKYFKYAIGEIILVVIGILIALSINNWNEKRLKHEQLISVYERIVIDMDKDVRQLSGAVHYYDSLEYVYKRVINDSITPDLFNDGLSRIITASYANTTLSTTGVNQLKELDVKDSLSLNVIGIYDFMESRLVNYYEKRINEESEQLVNIFLNKYDWYPEWMSKTILQNNSSKELQDYFLYSSEYRHRVINNYQLRYNNYLGSVKQVIIGLEKMKEALKRIIEKG